MKGGKLHIAVAGAGLFGREHLRILSGLENVTIVGIAEPNSVAARIAGERFGIAVDFDAVAMMERLKPDGIVIASSGATHLPLASAALARNIPVLLEKPVGFTAADADALIAAERKSNAFVLPGHILRFSANYRAAVEAAKSGEIGKVLSVAMRNHRDETHATRYPDVDPVLMTMVHDIDLALWITGGVLEQVFALRRPHGTSRSETLITATDTTRAMWHISNAWTYPSTETLPDRLEIIGDNGGVEIELGRSIRIFGKAAREIALQPNHEDQMLSAELAYFRDCLAQNRRPDVVTLEDARNGLIASDAIQESIRTGKIARP